MLSPVVYIQWSVSCQLPLYMAEEIAFEKWPEFQLWRACDLDLGSGRTAYRHASPIDLYLHAKFH